MADNAQRRIVSVFGSSRPKSGDEEYRIAHDLGVHLARAGYTVCNGGYGGTMEATARGAREAGGETIGVICSPFGRTANSYVSQTVITATLTERLTKLIELGDAYVILRGSTGTLLELAAVWEFMNKRLMGQRPIILLGTFWKKVIDTLGEELIHEGNLRTSSLVTFASDPAGCLEILTKSALGKQ